MDAGKNEPTLKLRTARTLKWNAIDSVATQVLYAVVGVVLANILSQEDFGLVGALLVFQAFAIIFVDGGFGAALLQKKSPDSRDYSTVFWFNLAVCAAVYTVLWFAAPLIAGIFQNDRRLIPLSRVMFLTFILNGLCIVQVNRLKKMMDVKQIAIADLSGLIVSGVIGISLAMSGYGAWALVWQSVSLAAAKSLWLWLRCGWVPSLVFDMGRLRALWPVGWSVFSSTFLNTLFLNIYSFVIGAFYSLRSLGVYTQADKWSKMGSASVSQVFTASFVPLLAGFQEDPLTHRRYMRRINRFAAMTVLPVMTGMAVIGEPLFHTLFGHKWDAAIMLFQLLCVRGIFVVLVSLYNNYLLSLGRSRALLTAEIVKDALTFAAIMATVFSESVELLVVGQLAASAATCAVVAAMTLRATGYRLADLLSDNLPFIFYTLLMAFAAVAVMSVITVPWARLVSGIAAGVVSYAGVLWLARVPELPEAAAYILGRFRRGGHGRAS